MGKESQVAESTETVQARENVTPETPLEAPPKAEAETVLKAETKSGEEGESATGKVESGAEAGKDNEKEATEANAEEIPLYPLPVKGPGGEEIELQVSPGDTVMDLRQFLSEAPETCFYTSYDLIMTTKEGVKYHLIDYIEVGEVTDVTGGGCLLEMYPALYDERSVRFHVRKFRELVSTTYSYSSLSTTLAASHEEAHALIHDKETEEKGEEKDSGKEAGGEVVIPPELENLGIKKQTQGLLKSLLLDLGTDDSDCLQSLAYSSFNPVPGHRRLQGDVAYFDLTTIEGKHFCVTAHTRGFLVNASSGNTLNPKPTNPKKDSITLVGLLKLISPKFAEAFNSVLEKKAGRHPFENMMPPLVPNPWLSPYPAPPHQRNMGRAEEFLMTPFGFEVTGIQRDWNEELQSCRELPKTSLQDRVMRDRALYRVFSEFVEASIRGAKAVVGRCLPPINPTDPERFHMYVHNSIFFSLAVDGDFAVLQQMREKELQAQAEAEEEASKKDGDKEKKKVEAGDKEEGKEDKKEGGESEAVQEAEQATYASANNDLRGTRLVNTVDAPGLATLAMVIVDFRGHRVIAQSIIPGILYGDKTAALKYGSVDSGAHIKYEEKFHNKFKEVSAALHLKEHEVKDKEGSVGKLFIPVECKGIQGSDDRQYFLDLVRLTPRDSNSEGPHSKLHVIRPELLAAFCQVCKVSQYLLSFSLLH